MSGWFHRRAGVLSTVVATFALLFVAVLVGGRSPESAVEPPVAGMHPETSSPTDPPSAPPTAEAGTSPRFAESGAERPKSARYEGRFPFLRVRGSVVDSEGSPIPGARVSGSFMDGQEARTAGGRTGSLGEFSLDFQEVVPRIAEPVERVRLEAAAAGFVPTVVQGVRVPWSEPAAVGALVLLRPGTIVGQTLDPAGGALPGATVSAYLLPGETDFPDALPADPSVTARSDETGAFRLVGIPPGVVRLAADAEGYAPALLDPFRIREAEEVSGVAIRVLAAGTIEGTTVDEEGRPVADAKVEFSAPDPLPVTSAISDAEGRFRLGPVRIGRNGQLRATTATASSQEIPAEGGARDVALRLLPLGRISGDVRELASRRACVGASVVARNADFPAPGFGREYRITDVEVHASTDAEGRFEVRVPPDRKYSVSASSPGFAERGERVEVRDGAPPPLVGILLPRLAPGSTVRGQVSDSRGEPPRHALVTVWGEELERPGRTVRARKDGTFEVPDVPPGTYGIRAWAPGFVSDDASKVRVVVPSEGEPPPVLLTVWVPGGIEGMVLVKGEAPSVTFEVSAVGSKARTKGDGTFELFPLKPGDYTVWVAAVPPSRTVLLQEDEFAPRRGPWLAHAQATVVEGLTAYVEIDAPDASFTRVHGAVHRDKEPVAGARIRLEHDRFRFRNNARVHPSMGATTGADGTFEFWTDVREFVELAVYEADFPLPASTKQVRLGEGGELEVLFDLLTAQLLGTTADPSGSPLPGTAINLAVAPPAPREAWTSGSVFSRPDGSFRIRGLPAGPYVLTVGKLGRGTRVERIDLAPLETRDLGAVTLPLARPVPVRLAWADGSALDQAFLRVETEDGLPVPPAQPLNREAGLRWTGTLPGWIPGPDAEHLNRRAMLRVDGGRAEIRHLGAGNWRLRLLGPAEQEILLRIGDRPPEQVEWTVDRGRSR